MLPLDAGVMLKLFQKKVSAFYSGDFRPLLYMCDSALVKSCATFVCAVCICSSLIRLEMITVIVAPALLVVILCHFSEPSPFIFNVINNLHILGYVVKVYAILVI